MSKAPQSIASAVLELRSKSWNSDAYLAGLIELADLDPQSDAVERAERLFTLRRRIAALKRRIRALETSR